MNRSIRCTWNDNPAAILRAMRSMWRVPPVDGHTLLLASNETMVLSPHYNEQVGYQPPRDSELVAPLVNMPFVLMLNTGLSFKTLDRLIAYLRMRPGEVNYGSPGEGGIGHLAGELL